MYGCLPVVQECLRQSRSAGRSIHPLILPSPPSYPRHHALPSSRSASERDQEVRNLSHNLLHGYSKTRIGLVNYCILQSVLFLNSRLLLWTLLSNTIILKSSSTPTPAFFITLYIISYIDLKIVRFAQKLVME